MRPAAPETCSREGCALPSRWTPVFRFLPPRSTGYSGPPAEARFVGMGLCDSHRAWFLEAGAQELAARLAAYIRSAGRPVDDARTTWVLEPAPEGR